MHILLILLGLLLLAVTLPLFLELLPLSLAALFTPGPEPAPPVPRFRLAIIIPAHNEQKLIGACIQSILKAPFPGLLVYVVAHNCTDQTPSIASTAGANVLTLKDSPGGKGAALDFGFSQALAAGAEAVLVVDADSTVSPNLCALVASRMASGADALQARYLVSNASSTPRTRLMSLAFLGMNLLRPLGRSRLGLSCGIFGNGFALSAETLRRVPYVANSVVEDLEYHLLLLRAGIRVDFLNTAAVLGEMPDNKAAASTQRARWEGGRILMRRRWTLPLLAEVASGRLILLEPLLDLLALPLATEAALLLLALLLPVPWLRLYATAGLLTLVLYVLVSARLSPDPAASLRALLAAPGYMLWKLVNLAKTRAAARNDAAWVRTERNPSTPADPEK